MANSVEVYLENFYGSYSPGDEIIGRVVFKLGSQKSARGVKLRIRGMEHNDWTEEESYYDSEEKTTKYRTVYYTGDNKFFALENVLSSEGDYPPGRYEYPFSFTLPKKLPATYQGKYGWIRYQIKAIVDIPWGSDYEYRKPFNVVAPIDFNEMHGLQLTPTAYSDDKMVCCCCCASGPVTMAVFLEKEAFVQGETAKIKVELKNLSNENIEGLEATIDMTVVSKTTSPSDSSKRDTERVASSYDSGVGAHGERTYEINMNIPRSVVVPNFTNCKLFKKWSTLEVKARMGGCANNLDIETTVELGHIPIQGWEEVHNSQVQQSSYTASQVRPPSMTYPPAGNCPPAYPAGIAPYPANSSAPYPLGPPSGEAQYPPGLPSGAIGFTMPMDPPKPAESTMFGPTLPTGSIPVVPVPHSAPYPPGPASSVVSPNAPPQESAPNAPTKAQMAEGDFVIVEQDSAFSPAPPSYNDAVKNPTMPYPPK